MEIVKKCEWCHKTFIGQMITVRFCSSKCCDQAYLHLNDLIRMFANTENPLWGMASDESVATRMEIMYAYSPK